MGEYVSELGLGLVYGVDEWLGECVSEVVTE